MQLDFAVRMCHSEVASVCHVMTIIEDCVAQGHWYN